MVDAAIAAGSTALLACERHEPIAYASLVAALRKHAVDVLLRDDGGARRFEVLLVTARPMREPNRSSPRPQIVASAVIAAMRPARLGTHVNAHSSKEYISSPPSPTRGQFTRLLRTPG